MSSILNDVKKNLGLLPDYVEFDSDILMHINSVLSTLNQLGVGPEDGYEVTGQTPDWSAIIGTEHRLNFVKTWVYLKVRLLFDPPTTSYTIAAFERQIEELTWRINNFRESMLWTPPNPPEPDAEEDSILDGGTP